MTWQEALMRLNDRIGETVHVTVRASGEITVLDARGVLAHVSPDEQHAAFEATLTERERNPEPGDLRVNVDRTAFEDDLAVYRVGESASFDLSMLDFIEPEGTDLTITFPLSGDGAELEVMFLDLVKPM